MPLGLTPEAMAGHRAAWADLAARALEPNVFSDPAFALPAVRHLAGWRRPRFLLARDRREPSRLIGLCCVAPPGVGLPLSAWLHPQATAAFPLLDAAEAGAALADLLGQAAVGLRPAGLIVHGLPAEGATMRLIEAEPRWWLAPLAARSRAVARQAPPALAGKPGKEFRRQARRLAEQGRVAVDASDSLEALEGFLALEAQGWKGRGATALAASPRRARFTREMVAALAADGRSRCYNLTLDGRPIAGGLVLRSGSHAFFWKTAFDESFARFSPGAHLAVAIGAAQARDPAVALTDSCAVPGHSMIDRLWPERMTVVDALLVASPDRSVAQCLALRVERMRRAARAWARRAFAAGRARAGRHNPNKTAP